MNSFFSFASIAMDLEIVNSGINVGLLLQRTFRKVVLLFAM